jgi:metal-dependent amidase/aminoacylase/carboxypeptidase family protein
MFIFKGKAAHAAASPHKGINALRSVLLTFNCVDDLREHVRQDVRIHGIILKGGDRVNIVPELAQAEFACRALDTATMEKAYARIVNCAKAAELGTGATLEFKEPRVALKAPVTVQPCWIGGSQPGCVSGESQFGARMNSDPPIRHGELCLLLR